MSRSYESGHLSLSLPGGGLHMKEQEDFLQAIYRVADRALKGAELVDVAPVVALRNRFRCQDGRMVEHLGLGIRATLLNDEGELDRLCDDVGVKGLLLSGVHPNEIGYAPARCVYQCALEWIQRRKYRTYSHETKMQKRHRRRYKLHRLLVKKAVSAMSRWVGQHSISEVKRRVRQAVVGKNVLDVACGDDDEILDFAQSIPLAVANDIASSQLRVLLGQWERRKKKGMPRSHELLLTNHDCLDLPFAADAFDVVFCRNTLHHMQTSSHLTTLFENMRRVGRRIVIVEVEDPARGGILARMLRLWYGRFLGDQGHSYMDWESFQDVVRTHHEGDRVRFSRYRTIRCNYMVAIIDKHK